MNRDGRGDQRQGWQPISGMEEMHSEQRWIPSLALVLGLICVGPACGDASDPAAPGAECRDRSECPSSMCVDGRCVPASTSDAGSSTTDAGMVGPPVDAMVDAGAPPPLSPPSPPSAFTMPVETLLRDAAPLADGVVVVGATERDAIANESRQGVVFHYGPDGAVRWAELVGDPSNDQFFAVANSSSRVIAAGLSRSYSVTARRNDDLFLAEVGPDGVRRAWHWGTTGDELLFGVFEGGDVAAWIGVGVISPNPDEPARDALVVAFDAEMTPMWGLTFDVAEDDVFYDGVVVGPAVYLVGRSGSLSEDGLGQGLVVALTPSEVLWARGFDARVSGAVGIHADPSDGSIVVLGSVAGSEENASDPLILRFAPSGRVIRGQRVGLGTPGVATNLFFGEGGTILAGSLFGEPFFALYSESGLGSVVPFEPGVVTQGFRPLPMLAVGGELHMVHGGATRGTILDMPFTFEPASTCTGAPVVAPVSDLDAGEVREVSLTRRAIALAGTEIASLRKIAISVTAEALTECPAPPAPQM